MARVYSKTPKGGVRMGATKVRLPRANTLGSVRSPVGFGGKSRGKDKSYAKTAFRSDPTEFTNVGFGVTDDE
jgi:hypothetical protein